MIVFGNVSQKELIAVTSNSKMIDIDRLLTALTLLKTS